MHSFNIRQHVLTLVLLGIVLVALVSALVMRAPQASENAVAQATVAPKYKVTELDKNLFAYGDMDLNNAGHVAASRYYSEGSLARRQAVLITAAKKLWLLGTFAEEPSSYVTGMNDNNEVVGMSGLRVFAYNPKSQKLQEPELTTSGSLSVVDINNKSEMLGRILKETGHSESVLFKKEGESTLIDDSSDYSYPSAINDKSEVVGVTGGQAFLSTVGNSGERKLERLGYWSPRSLNNKQMIVGVQNNAPVIWSREQGIKSLITLPGSGQALSVSDGGLVVGSVVQKASGPSPRAFAYSAKDGVVDLNKRVDTNGWTLYRAYKVNNSGQILVGASKYDKKKGLINRLWLLTPSK